LGIARVFPGLTAFGMTGSWSFMSKTVPAGRSVAAISMTQLAGRFFMLTAVVIGAFAAQVASATPVLPSAALASQAVKSALTTAPAKAAPVKAATKPAAATAAAARAQGVSRASSTPTRSTGRSAVVHSTAYNSTPGQTDNSPFITATGTRVRPGVVALSRDLLGRFPYGTRVTIEDLSGRYNNFLRGRIFIVEDTMNVRIANTVDVWMGTRYEAMAWGSRNIRITAVR
jgi:3D (Asp-Asp-Asp) domain-containing protein